MVEPLLGWPRMTPSAPQSIKIVLADDHDLVRAGIRALLSAVPGVQVMADVKDGVELLAVLESTDPDVVITDLSMPRLDGMAAIAEIRARHPEIHVLVLSMHDSLEAVKKAIAAGACGYLRKDAKQFELELALHTVMSTGSYFGSSIAQRLLEPVQDDGRKELTGRQVEILTLLARGKSSKEIAFELGLSSKTVDVHRGRIMERTGIHDIASLTLYAVRAGLVKI
jgi:DNA-binding NarL/FixJ family response regulator